VTARHPRSTQERAHGSAQGFCLNAPRRPAGYVVIGVEDQMLAESKVHRTRISVATAAQVIDGATLRARLHLAPDGSVQRVDITGAILRERMFERSARAALSRRRFPSGSGDRVYDTEVAFKLE
jgi:hypothetical protein